MNGVVIVVGKRLHIVENDPVYNKYGKAGDEFPGNRRKEKKCVKDEYQYQLIGLVTDQAPRKQ
jgi:hypothetical protein